MSQFKNNLVTEEEHIVHIHTTLLHLLSIHFLLSYNQWTVSPPLCSVRSSPSLAIIFLCTVLHSRLYLTRVL